MKPFQKWSVLAVALLLIIAQSALATTYYVDFASGNDANSGQDTAHPWKRQPYMAGWAGSYGHQAGDRFIFKGGVTWPASCLVWIIKAGGTVGNSDYYGVDQSWFTGAAWTRPIIDGQSVAPYFVLVGNNNPYTPSAPNVTFDNFEMRNLRWTGHNQFGTVTFFNQVDGNSNLVVKNCYIHDWTHGTAASGTTDDLIVFTGTAASPFNSGCIVQDTIVDGGASNSSNGNSSGAGFKLWGGKILRCQVRNCVSAIMQGGGVGLNSEVAYNDVGPVFVSFDPNQHDNGIHTVSGGDHYMHDNYVHDTQSVCMMMGESSNERNWCWNNVIWNAFQSYAFYFDTTVAGSQHYIWNNTVAANPFRVIFRSSGQVVGALSLIDNHIVYDGSSILTIDPGSSITSFTNLNNVKITSAQATAQGYTANNKWQPFSVTGSSVINGTDLSLVLSGALTKDILGTTRPGTTGWNVGAYEWAGGGGSPPATPSNVSPANNASSVGLTPVLTLSAYGGPGTQADSQFQVLLNGSTIWDSGSAGATSSTTVSSPLSYATTYQWKGRYANAIGWSSYSAPTTFTTIVAPPPNTPSNVSPTNNSTGVALRPTLTGSAYSDPNASSQQASQWLIYASDGVTLILDSGAAAASSSFMVPDATLTYSTTYKWKVRYQNSFGSWSAYSSLTSFTTLAASPPNTPSNVSPANGATNQPVTLTISASAYSDPQSSAQQASEWTIDHASTNVLDTVVGAVTSITVQPNVLQQSLTYSWKVRYKNALGVWSAYSNPTTFTTTPPLPPDTPSNLVPTNNAPSVTITPALTASAYHDPNALSQSASEWIVALLGTNIWDSVQGPAVTTTVPFGILTFSTPYSWSVRYKNSAGIWSGYSSPTSFTTTNSPSTIGTVTLQLGNAVFKGTVISQ